MAPPIPPERTRSGALQGHYWTIVPNVLPQLSAFAARSPGARRLLGALRGSRAGLGEAAGKPWSGSVQDARFGRIALSGRLHAPPGATTLLLCVHGLGGNADSPYLELAARGARSRGWACLRVSMRGADGSGEDFYHAALTADLHAALASPALAAFTQIFVIGYSLGGHLTLRLASEELDARVRAVAAVCAPIDLARSAAAIDRPALWPYRQYVLWQLKRDYATVARRRDLPAPLQQVLEVRTLREWDACTVVPRHGFADTADYYARASAAPRLGELRVPALLANSTHDPMVPASSVRPALPSVPASAPRLDVRWIATGGHVGFPLAVDLGEAGPAGLESQVLAWLERHAA